MHYAAALGDSYAAASVVAAADGGGDDDCDVVAVAAGGRGDTAGTDVEDVHEFYNVD